MDQPPQMPPMGAMNAPNTGATNEELIEAIIDEKWNELVKDITKIIEWKNSTETRVSAMEQQMKDLQNSFDKLHQGVIGKIGEYDKHILDVGAEIKAMEKVFEKILPVFTENVSALSRVTDDIRAAVKK